MARAWRAHGVRMACAWRVHLHAHARAQRVSMCVCTWMVPAAGALALQLRGRGRCRPAANVRRKAAATNITVPNKCLLDGSPCPTLRKLSSHSDSGLTHSLTVTKLSLNIAQAAGCSQSQVSRAALVLLLPALGRPLPAAAFSLPVCIRLSEYLKVQ